MKNFTIAIVISLLTISFFGCDRSVQETAEDEQELCDLCEEQIMKYLNTECWYNNSDNEGKLESFCMFNYSEADIQELRAWAFEACRYNEVKAVIWDDGCDEEFLSSLSFGDHVSIDFNLYVQDTFPGSFLVKYYRNGSRGTFMDIVDGGKNFEYFPVWTFGLRYGDEIGFDIKTTGVVSSDYGIEFVNQEEIWPLTFHRDDPFQPRDLYITLVEIDEENMVYRYEYDLRNY